MRRSGNIIPLRQPTPIVNNVPPLGTATAALTPTVIAAQVVLAAIAPVELMVAPAPLALEHATPRNVASRLTVVLMVLLKELPFAIIQAISKSPDGIDAPVVTEAVTLVPVAVLNPSVAAATLDDTDPVYDMAKHSPTSVAAVPVYVIFMAFPPDVPGTTNPWPNNDTPAAESSTDPNEDIVWFVPVGSNFAVTVPTAASESLIAQKNNNNDAAALGLIKVVEVVNPVVPFGIDEMPFMTPLVPLPPVERASWASGIT